MDFDEVNESEGLVVGTEGGSGGQGNNKFRSFGVLQEQRKAAERSSLWRESVARIIQKLTKRLCSWPSQSGLFSLDSGALVRAVGGEAGIIKTLWKTVGFGWGQN
ncbi:hypothetical protein NDU88_007003 [Pleurodeles waltl]|uniref:Uncharacterized protein n=1 Tax=Pleurodeles waltl TaxID=8319 RepID=A0AAV7PN18_PLEWA|nr:hypothetical protein NDU88_007003 [Pleurodeles waltl]